MTQGVVSLLFPFLTGRVVSFFKVNKGVTIQADTGLFNEVATGAAQDLHVHRLGVQPCTAVVPGSSADVLLKFSAVSRVPDRQCNVV